jgi:DDE superfamily endonuclease
VEQTVATDDPDPTALACYGLLVRWAGPTGTRHEEAWLRFVDGRPVSALTIHYLAGCCARLQALGKTALLLVWDNAAWHVSKAVRSWLRQHNRAVKQAGTGVRIVACFLPIKSPWLNPIEPQVGARQAPRGPTRSPAAGQRAHRPGLRGLRLPA